MRYLIFAGAAYYSAGGARDLIDSRDSLESAEGLASRIIGMTGHLGGEDEEIVKLEWSHVLDLETKSIVAKFGDSPYGRSWGEDMVKTVTQ